MDSVFVVEKENVTVGPFAAGPWNPGMQHGGAPAALAVWVAEKMPTAAPMRVARMTLDLLRPVPVAHMRIKSEIVREGKRIQLVCVHLESKGVEVARATILKVRVGTPDFADITLADPLDVELPEQSGDRRSLPLRADGFVSGATLRTARGEFAKRGPAAIWFCFDRTLVAGHVNSPAMCAVATADFSNGVSSELDFADWTFVNADLSVSFAREPQGAWILLNAQTWLGDDGGGIAAARLADRKGYFGRVVQTLVVERR